MEYHRRNRRRKGRSGLSIPPEDCIKTSTKSSSSINSFCSYFIMTILIAIIYLLFDYHCMTCASRCNFNNITKSIEDITNNLSDMKVNYRDLEKRVMEFSQEFPKFKGQLEILEALANTMAYRDYGWDPKTHLPLPNVDVTLNKAKQHPQPELRNKTTNNVKLFDIDIE